MDIQSVNTLRPLLFEALEHKVRQLYYATRSKKYIDEVRDYILVVMGLTNEYVAIHAHDFRLKRGKYMQRSRQGSDSPIAYMEGWNNPRNFRKMLESEDIKMSDIHSIRRWVWFVFDKILELHCFFEGLDYRLEHDDRYSYIRGLPVLRSQYNPKVIVRKRRSGGGVSRGIGGNSFGSIFLQRSGEFRARKEYECMNCPHPISPGEYYQREVIRLGESLMTMRYHSTCPDDPNDPERRHHEDDLTDQDILAEQKKAA